MFSAAALPGVETPRGGGSGRHVQEDEMRKWHVGSLTACLVVLAATICLCREVIKAAPKPPDGPQGARPQSAPDVSWLAKPKAELSAEVTASVGVIFQRSMMYPGPGLSFDTLPSSIRKKGQTEYRPAGNAYFVVSARTQEGTEQYWSQPFDGLKNQIQTDYSSLSGLTFASSAHFNGVVFAEAKAVAVCSNPIRFSDGQAEHTFVLVFHEFVLKNTNPGSAGTMYTYEATKTDVWPYEEQFLEKQKLDAKLSEAEHQAAIGLLSAIASTRAQMAAESSAALWAKTACEGKNAGQCCDLGLSYATGKGVEKNLSKAAALWREACDGGNAAGCYDLGVFYRKGWGVARDDAKALELAQKACDLHMEQACAAVKKGFE
jgi:hypothetical protein